MKKALSLILAILMCLSLWACSTSSEPQIVESTPPATTEATCRRDHMSESAKEDEALRAAVEEVVWRLENKGYYTDNAKYKIGSINKVEENTYAISGTIRLYDKYGSFDKNITFTCSGVWIDKDGKGVSVGAVDIKS